MRAFLEPLHALEEIARLETKLKKEPGIRMISGCIDSQKPHLMYGIGNDFKYKVIVTFNDGLQKYVIFLPEDLES